MNGILRTKNHGDTLSWSGTTVCVSEPSLAVTVSVKLPLAGCGAGSLTLSPAPQAERESDMTASPHAVRTARAHIACRGRAAPNNVNEQTARATAARYPRCSIEGVDRTSDDTAGPISACKTNWPGTLGLTLIVDDGEKVHVGPAGLLEQASVTFPLKFVTELMVIVGNVAVTPERTFCVTPATGWTRQKSPEAVPESGTV